VQWHDISDPAHGDLDKLAAAYGLHPLHVEDARNGAQRTKADDGRYLFLILKLLYLDDERRMKSVDLSLFVGQDFLITVHEGPAPLLDPLRRLDEPFRSDQVLHLVMNEVVESYIPTLERLEDGVEELHDLVVNRPGPAVLVQLGEIRNAVLHLRRVLGAMRHVTSQLRHSSNPLISRELHPFLRDVDDDLAIMLESIARERDRLAGVLDIYLSSVATRSMEATRTLTLLGTIVLPALVITSIFGMNVAYPGWTRSSWIFGCLVALTIASSASLGWILGRRNDPSRTPPPVTTKGTDARAGESREAVKQTAQTVYAATQRRDRV
jgi:magnesium transporter